MIRNCLLAVFLFLFFTHSLYAQKEASIWYFGHNAGISFANGNPVVLTDGQIYTDEGVASIADVNGSLLFYTEGTTVWNKQHQIMPNGQGLLGSFSSSQSAIIVPKINDPDRYYIFTVAQLGEPDGFNYSIVNIKLDNGKGDVEAKNVPLLTPVSEKLTAVKHCNGRDIWVIVHGWNSAKFYAYLVTESGVSTNPVVSTTGTFVANTNSWNAIGCMKTSPDGKKLAIAHHYTGADLADFDNKTGIVSNALPIFLPTERYGNYRGAYGVEFSPNSKYLYISGDYFNYIARQEQSYLLQYDVSLPDHASIQATKKVISEQQSYWSTENYGSLQMAPDGRMYMAEMTQLGISIINYPNLEGAACDFQSLGLSTNHNTGGRSRYGLPSFIQSYFRPSYTFRGACTGTVLLFDYARADNELSVKWDFGDPASGAANSSTLDSSQHTFTSEGIYTVKLIRYTVCGSDTITKTINAGVGQLTLGKDTLLCGSTQFTILPQTTSTSNSYTWQDGSTSPTFTANKDGLYWVEVKNNLNGCTLRDSIELTFRPYPPFSLGNDLNKCDGDVVNLSVNLSQSTYLWNNGSTANNLQITQPGEYWLQVARDGCIKRDSVVINYRAYPIVKLGKDTILCEGTSLQLDAKNTGMQYQWQNNSTNQTYTVNTPGKYWVQVTNLNCVANDTIDITYLDKPLFKLGRDTNICIGLTIELAPKIDKGSGLSFLWSNGATTKNISVQQEGNYVLTISNQCGIQSDEMKINKGVCKLYVPSAFTPNGDGLNDVLKALYGENLSTYSFTIYNRYGQVVFSTNQIAQGWDGKYKGILQDSGVFIWTIRYKTIIDNEEKLMKGTSVLIR